MPLVKRIIGKNSRMQRYKNIYRGETPKLSAPILYKNLILNIKIIKNKATLNIKKILLVDNTEKYSNIIIGDNKTKNTLSNNSEKKNPDRESSLIKNILPKKCIIKYFAK